MASIIKCGTHLFTSIQNTVLMVLQALQELYMFYGIRVHLLAFQRLPLLCCALFLTLLSFPYGVTFPEHPLKRGYISYNFFLGHSDFLCALKRAFLKRHIVFLRMFLVCELRLFFLILHIHYLYSVRYGLM